MTNLDVLLGRDATSAYPVVRKIAPADLKGALTKGVNDFLPFLDFLAQPLYLVSLSIIYATISMRAFSSSSCGFDSACRIARLVSGGCPRTASSTL